MKLFKINFSNGKTTDSTRIDSVDEISNALIKLGLQLGRPTLILIGGAGGLSEPDLQRLYPLFVNVLARFAENFQVNVIDGGTDAGVMRLMGLARAEINAKFPLIGVAANGTVILPNIESAKPEAAALESHHTHFIIVPGDNWGDESPWLNHIATALAKQAPSATVLINGGEIARKDIRNSITAKRPVVVIAGTGRLADELASDEKQLPLTKIVNQTEGFENITQLLIDLLKEDYDGKV